MGNVVLMALAVVLTGAWLWSYAALFGLIRERRRRDASRGVQTTAQAMIESIYKTQEPPVEALRLTLLRRVALAAVGSMLMYAAILSIVVLGI